MRRENEPVLSATELKRLVDRNIPPNFIRTAVTALAQANRKAREKLSDLPKPERRDVFGHLQRAYLEKLWRHNASDIEGVTSRVSRNKQGTSSFTEVRMGRLIITASAVDRTNSLPRGAEFRNTRAVSNQGDLFDKAQLESHPIYGIFTHCTNGELDVYAAGLVLPDETGTRPILYLPWTEELLLAVSEEKKHLADADEERVPEPQPQGLRGGVKRKIVSGLKDG